MGISLYDLVGTKNRLPQKRLLWHEDYFELNTADSENALYLPHNFLDVTGRELLT